MIFNKRTRTLGKGNYCKIAFFDGYIEFHYNKNGVGYYRKYTDEGGAEEPVLYAYNEQSEQLFDGVKVKRQRDSFFLGEKEILL